MSVPYADLEVRLEMVFEDIAQIRRRIDSLSRDIAQMRGSPRAARLLDLWSDLALECRDMAIAAGLSPTADLERSPFPSSSRVPSPPP